MIYFLKSPAGHIKIGTTIKLSQRLKQLASEHGEGLEVLAVGSLIVMTGQPTVATTETLSMLG